MKTKCFITALGAGALLLAENAGAFILANNSEHDITGIYTAAPDSPDWGKNLIKGRHLGSKQSCSLAIEVASDKFDLLIETRTGKKQEFHEYPAGVRQITLKTGGESFFTVK